MRPPEACVLQVNDILWCHPKEVPNHSLEPFPGLCPAGGMTSRLQFEHLSLSPFSKNNLRHIFFASTWPTNINTYLFYSILFYSILFYPFQKKTSYIYCARLTETCHDTCILLLFRLSDCFLNLLICTLLWIKASAKWFNVNVNVMKRHVVLLLLAACICFILNVPGITWYFDVKLEVIRHSVQINAFSSRKKTL